MPLIGIASLHGSPGVTSLAVALAARMNDTGRPALIVEADPDGGVLAARLDLSLVPNLTDLAGAARRSLDTGELAHYAQRVNPQTPIIVAHPSGEQTSAALRASGASLAHTFVEADFRVVADLGRWRTDSPANPLIEVADPLVLVIRSALEDIVQVLHLLDRIDRRERLRLVAVGERPYSGRQIKDATGLPVVACLPGDRKQPSRMRVGGAARRDAWASAVSVLTETLSGNEPSSMSSSTH
ncbi:MAG: hypothetical protein WCH93_07965 [Actinomycetota bacterium]